MRLFRAATISCHLVRESDTLRETKLPLVIFTSLSLPAAMGIKKAQYIICSFSRTKWQTERDVNAAQGL